MISRRLLAAPFALAAGLLAGCGGESTGSVSGKVTFDGKPLEGATVFATPKAGGIPIPAMVGADGTYLIPNVPVGDHMLSVTVPPDETQNVGAKVKEMGNTPITRATAPTAGGPPPVPAAKVKIPAIYNDPGTANLFVTVKAGDTATLDIPITR